MVGPAETLDVALGRRARFGQWCHHSGLLWWLHALRARTRRDLRILAYHRVLPPADTDDFDFDPELISASVQGFRRQMQLLSRRFQPVPLMQAVEALIGARQLPPNAVAVTFDDGYDDNYLHAFPVLRELHIPATFFVSTDHIDTGLPYAFDWFVHMILCTPARELSIPEVGLVHPLPEGRPARLQLAWDALDRLKSLSDAALTSVLARLQQDWNMPARSHPGCHPMTWDQLREIHAAGFEIGSHGVHHRMLAKLGPPEQDAELRESRAAIARELGTPAVSIAYPVGANDSFDDRVIQATRDAGYQAACTYISGTNGTRARSDRYALRRLPVERYMRHGWFAAMLVLPGLASYPSRHRVQPEAT